MFNGYWYKESCVWIKERYNSRVRGKVGFGRESYKESADKRSNVGGLWRCRFYYE
jgi:hypothetical protein